MTDCPTLTPLIPPPPIQNLYYFAREQLVSTMDAERALRVRTVEVPKFKAVAARKGPILSAAGKGMPYIVNPVALKVFTDIVSHMCAVVDPKDKQHLVASSQSAHLAARIFDSFKSCRICKTKLGKIFDLQGRDACF